MTRPLLDYVLYIMKRVQANAVALPFDKTPLIDARIVTPLLSSATSFLTATVLIYTHRAGIPAAAGTRLALQLLSVRVLNYPHYTS